MQVLWARRRIEVNTDPQRRCYNGCHFSSELQWLAWESFGRVPAGKEESQLQWWRELSDFAVSQRGPSAKTEYVLLPEGQRPAE